MSFTAPSLQFRLKTFNHQWIHQQKVKASLYTLGNIDYLQIQPSLKAELLLVYFLTPHQNKNCNKALHHWLQKSFLKGIKRPVGGMGREGKNWRDLEPGDDVFTIFKQLRTFLVVPDVLSKFSKIENLFFFRGSVRCQHQLKLYSFERD